MEAQKTLGYCKYKGFWGTSCFFINTFLERLLNPLEALYALIYNSKSSKYTYWLNTVWNKFE